MEIWKSSAPDEPAETVLLKARGGVREAEFQRLLSQRDDHFMHLLE
jgi:hypothetical protein